MERLLRDPEARRQSSREVRGMVRRGETRRGGEAGPLLESAGMWVWVCSRRRERRAVGHRDERDVRGGWGGGGGGAMGRVRAEREAVPQLAKKTCVPCGVARRDGGDFSRCPKCGARNDEIRILLGVHVYRSRLLWTATLNAKRQVMLICWMGADSG